MTLASSLIFSLSFAATSLAIKPVPLPSDNLGPPTSLGFCNNGEWIKYSSIDFGTGKTVVGVNIGVQTPQAGQIIELRIDSPTGLLIGTVTPQSTGDAYPSWYNYCCQLGKVSGSGVHDLFFVFKGSKGGVCNLQSFTFS